MKPDVLVVVMTHPEADTAYARNHHLWAHHGFPILTFTTATHHRVRFPREVLAFGSPQHHGAASLDRFRFLMNDLSRRPHDFFLINEYDSFVLSPELPEKLFEHDALWSNLHHEKPGTKFVSTCFLHPPLFMSRHTLQRVAPACRHEDPSNLGFWDRYLGHICELDSIPMLGFRELGFSINTIHEAHYLDAAAAIAGGAVAIHGVKDPGALQIIEKSFVDRALTTGHLL